MGTTTCTLPHLENHPNLSQPRWEVDRSEAVAPMRDGAGMRTHLALPRGEGPYPAILVRGPYPFGDPPTKGYEFYAQRGYAVVVQYVRGRYGSDGEWLPYLNEGQDGYDAIDWIVRQPWSSGRVGMLGGSYVGWTQVAAALEGHPALKAIVPHASPYPPIPSIGSSGGTFLFHQVPIWAAAVHGSERNNIDGMPWARILSSLPVLDILDGEMGEALHRRCIDTFARVHRQFLADSDFGRVPPAQVIGGWHDHILHDTLDLYRRAPTARLIVGPWSHGDYGHTVGDLDFGDEVGSLAEVQQVQSLRWLDCHLKGIDTGLADEPPVRIFITGRNRWHFEDEWPVSRARPTAFYLHSQGQAHRVDRAGMLSPSPPGTQPADRYVYDPSDPVPTLGGANSGPCGSAGMRRGPLDQREIEARPDVLCYRTDGLAAEVEAIGSIQVVLYISSDARDTDFTAKVLDVYPDGRAMALQDGILRCRYRDSFAEERFLEPGQIAEIRIDLPPIAHVFMPGHRIGLDVSSSNFPRFDRNLNTGQDNERTTAYQVARQVIYHDDTHPSRLILPLIVDGKAE